MTDRSPSDPSAAPNTISPLPGEPGIPNVAERRRGAISGKGLLAVGLMVSSLILAAGFTIHRFASSGKKAGEQDARLASDRPAAATADPRRLDLLLPAGASAPVPHSHRVPALLPTAQDAEPIGVRRSATSGPSAGGPHAVLPMDAPAMLVTSRPGQRGLSGTPSPARTASPARDGDAAPAPGTGDTTPSAVPDLQAYQQQLQGLLHKLTQAAAQAAGQASETMSSGALLGGPPMVGSSPNGGPAVGGSLFGGQLLGSATPKVAAATLGNRSLTLPKGTAFTCALKTKVISATSGLVGCQVQRNVFSDDGRVLLIERGSHLDGEYRIASVRPGTVRIPVLWTRIRTPVGVTVDIDSPGTGQLGESGIDGYVDNRWRERIGAAMLLSLIDDSVKLVIQNQSSDSNAGTVVLPTTTANTSKLAEKVLDSTINIPPLIYQNQGGIVGIYVARDVDFSSVYELKPTAIAPQREGTP